MLPSSRRALRLWSDADYPMQIEDWLSEGIIIPVEQRNNVAATQLQSAFEAVLGGTSAADAASAALGALSSGN